MPNTCSGHSKAVDRRGPAYTDGVKTDADSDGKVASTEDDHTPRGFRGPRETAGTLECCCRNEPLENQALQGETRSKRCRIMLLRHCRGIRRKINKATATALTTGRGLVQQKLICSQFWKPQPRAGCWQPCFLQRPPSPHCIFKGRPGVSLSSYTDVSPTALGPELLTLFNINYLQKAKYNHAAG